MATLAPVSLPLARRRKQIFESVFPSATSSLASPSTPIYLPPQPAHGYNTRHHPNPPVTPTPGTVSLLPDPTITGTRTARAWALATAFLRFGHDEFPSSFGEWVHGLKVAGKDVREALQHLVSIDGGAGDTGEQGRESLSEWYVCEVRRHFLEVVVKGIEIPETYDNPQELLEGILYKLTTAQNIYLFLLKTYLLPSSPIKQKRKIRKRADDDDGNDDLRVQNFKHCFNTIVSYSLPDPAWSNLVYTVLLDLCGAAVGLPDQDGTAENKETDEMDMEDSFEAEAKEAEALERMAAEDTEFFDEDSTQIDDSYLVHKDPKIASQQKLENTEKKKRDAAREKVLETWSAMEKLGVGGGRRGERVFAEVINTLLTTYITRSYSFVWVSPSNIITALKNWVTDTLGTLITSVLFSSTPLDWQARLKKLSPRESLRATRLSMDKFRKSGMELDGGAGATEEEYRRREEDLESWKRIACVRLGKLRVGELFDIVVDWPTSEGGVEDLRAYISTPQTRLHLTSAFTNAVSFRLLHPGAATADILRAYIALIRAFSVLDPLGVLLENVAMGVRRYLRERDDTIRVIVKGIMADPDSSSTSEDELPELATELKNLPGGSQSGSGLEELDFDDMHWVPDPVDAGPEFRKSMGGDVIGSLLGLWENKEVWVKEVQAVLAQRLIAGGWEPEKEVRVVELLKRRFGETAMQGCDVMLKDIADSERICGRVKGDWENDASQAKFEVKVLSRLFWPTMKEDTFSPPPQIAAWMEEFEEGFEELKKKRKLAWYKSAGTVNVELEFEDRNLNIPDATPLQAAVIYSFNSDSDKSDKSVSMTLSQLQEKLQADPVAIKRALHFWISKEALIESPADVYTVVEKQDSLITSGAQQTSLEMEQEPKEVNSEERKMLEMFVVGMLTNGGPAGTDRIWSMLSALVPGFRGGIEEVGEFLVGLRDAGVLGRGEGGWKLAK
ncbi:hypothetical protein RUND412_004214 [Rhizina undulata]